MTSTIDLSPILDLPVQQRIDVVHAILESIARETAHPVLSEEFKQELLRRRDDALANPGDGIPWETVRAELQARLQK